MERPPVARRDGRLHCLGTITFLGALGMSAPNSFLPAGAWGGEQVMLTVGPNQAVLTLGCARGTFPAPIRLDAEGAFGADGQIEDQAAGPDVANRPPATVRARFDGRLSGDTLALTVNRGPATERYILRHGVQSKVIGCY